jgi:hypothetical protein
MRLRNWIIGFVIVAGLVGGWIAVYRLSFASPQPIKYGVTFDQEYAQFLGLDPRMVFTEMLTDLNIKYVRLAVQWDEVEKEPGQLSFGDIDWYLDQAKEHDVHVTLAIGQKTPRWPECHPPAWAVATTTAAYEAGFNTYIKSTVERYRDREVLEFWQVENEPFVPFGECPKFNTKLIPATIKMVRDLDPYHPVIVTDSGELTTWRQAAHLGTYFGTTLYRLVWNKYLGYVNYDIIFPPAFYRFKAWINGIAPEQAMISELQAEPWIPNGSILTTSVTEQFKTMSPELLTKNVEFAGRVGFSRVSLWGVEWWYWLKDKAGDPRMVEMAKGLFLK